jgi:alpha-tubulin suppressor-like RCC1 family protein
MNFVGGSSMKTSIVYHENQYFFIKEVLNVFVIIVCLTSRIVSADVFLDAGDYQTCGITKDDNIACWGNNAVEPIPATIVAPFTQISVGMFHTCVINNLNQMNCWVNTNAPLNLDTSPSSPIPVEHQEGVLQVSVGDDDICALTSNKDITCWNYNSDSQTLTSTSATGPFKQVSVGSAHTCALTEPGQAKCWGNNDFGQAPSEPVAGPFTQISAAGYHTCGLTVDGKINCWGENTNNQTPASEVGPFISISTGFSHTCAVMEGGSIKCWGNDDTFGEVSLPSQAKGNFVEVSVGFDHTCAVNAEGIVSCWGDNSYKQTEVPSPLVLKVNAPTTGKTIVPSTDGTTITPKTGETITPPTGDSTPTVVGSNPTATSEPTSCDPATYSNETREVTLPYVEVPLYTDVNGQAILSIGLFSATLGIPFGFSDIKVETLTFIKTIAQTDPCHAQFTPENGLLMIPALKVPTIVPYLKSEPISGPIVQCNAKLQQSILRPDVLSLIEFNCGLP